MIRLKEPYDYTEPGFDRLVAELSERTAGRTDHRLRQLQQTDTGAYLALGTAARVVASWQAAAHIQQYLDQQRAQLNLYVIQPVFREGRRLMPRSAENPYGENALVYKLSRFDRLSAQFPRIRFSVIVIDDGCDGGGDPDLVSSKVAHHLIAGYRQANPDSCANMEVLLLNNLIREAPALGWEARMESPAVSHKGGSVLAGFAYARHQADRLQGNSGKQFSLFVDYDADLSLHPDQVMLLAEKVLVGGHDGAVASRRHKEAISYIDPERDRRGQDYIQAWQVLLPILAAQVTDVNRGLKAYSQTAVNTILATVEERTFPFQIECLLAIVISLEARLAEVPVSYIDSVALSTQAGEEAAQAYEDQLGRIRQIARRYGQAT